MFNFGSSDLFKTKQNVERVMIKPQIKAILLGLFILLGSAVFLIIDLTNSTKHELKFDGSTIALLIAIGSSILLILRGIKLSRSS